MTTLTGAGSAPITAPGVDSPVIALVDSGPSHAETEALAGDGPKAVIALSSSTTGLRANTACQPTTRDVATPAMSTSEVRLANAEARRGNVKHRRNSGR